MLLCHRDTVYYLCSRSFRLHWRILIIFSEANFSVYRDEKGIYFDSPDVNLDEDSLVVPADCEGGLGTIEFHRRYVILHPANSESKKLSALEFIKVLEIQE